MSKLFVFLSSLCVYILCSSFFIVSEGEKGIILQLGKILKNNKKETIVYQPGYHCKWPILEQVTMFDSRIQNINNHEDHFLTKDNKDVVINSYIQWRINNFGHYYLSTRGGDIFQVQDLLKREFKNQLRAKIRKLTLKEIVSDSYEKLIKDIFNTLNAHALALDNLSLKNANSITELGVRIIDVGITHIALPVKVYDRIYNQMKSEQKNIEQKCFLESKKKSEKLRSNADYNMSFILSEAHKKAFIIKNKAEEMVTRLFLKNFNQAPDFYFFIHNLYAYENSFFDNRNLMMVNLSHSFFRYIKNITDSVK